MDLRAEPQAVDKRLLETFERLVEVQRAKLNLWRNVGIGFALGLACGAGLVLLMGASL